MTTTKHTDEHRSPSRFLAAGATIAAGALLLVSALLTLFQGISAVLADELFVIGPAYVYQVNTTFWGWVQIVVGVLVGLVAIGLFIGATWARIAAIIMASLSIIAMFLWLPYYPIWSLVVIALDIIVIWAVATWDRSEAP